MTAASMMPYEVIMAEDAKIEPGTKVTVCSNASMLSEAVASKSTSADTMTLPAE